jgi:hypothetical protein
MICTDRYVEKANSGTGGVGYEKMIITSDLLASIDSNKIIPIIRQNGSFNVPTFLKSKLFIDFSKNDGFEFSYDELTRAIHNAPLYKKPKIGNNPFTPVSESPPEKNGNALKELILIVINDYENGSDWSGYFITHKKLGTSRLMYDSLIKEAKEEKLIILSSERNIYITEKGKEYALLHKLVSF